MAPADHRYLIIGGSPKAGTTSLYRWLSAHPDVCPSSLKETRFFLDSEYPAPSSRRYDGTNLASYDAFFSHCGISDNPLRIEATPDYLYAPSAVQIARLLPRSQMVIILRDPIDRLVSWYKYARQRGFIPQALSFPKYVQIQIEQPITTATPVHLRALDQGRYWKYLPAFRDAFGSRLIVLDFEMLRSNPDKAMDEICSFCQINADFFQCFPFTPENVSGIPRFPRLAEHYQKTRRRIAQSVHGHPRIAGLLRIPNRLIKRVIATPVSIADDIQVDSATRDRIQQALRKTS